MNEEKRNEAQIEETEEILETPTPIDCCFSFDDYQEKAFSTALEAAKNMPYMVMGMTGEAGEIANKAKKTIRDNKEFDREDLIGELGDVIWYVAGLATLYGISLQEVADQNIKKLFSRKERGVLQGSGDKR